MPDKSRVRLTASEARAAFMTRAGELWDGFDAWYEANPEATFDEIDEHLGQRRRTVLGELLELRLRQDDLGATPEAPRCEGCGNPMDFKGYLAKNGIFSINWGKTPEKHSKPRICYFDDRRVE